MREKLLTMLLLMLIIGTGMAQENKKMQKPKVMVVPEEA